MRNTISVAVMLVTSCAFQLTAGAQNSLKFTSVVMGHSHACATTADGVAYCWGDNDHGQIGNGTKKDQLTPVPIGGSLRFKQIVHGGSANTKEVAFFTCGIGSDDQAYCWGNNDLGQLGDGTRKDRFLPAPVAGGSKFDALQAGAASACGLTNERRVFCWGAPGAAGLALSRGTRKVMTSDKPTEIALPGAAKPVLLIRDGIGDPCVLDADGVAYCWIESGGRIETGAVSLPGKAFQSIQLGGLGKKCGVTTAGDLLCWTESKDGRIELSLDSYSGRVPPPAGTVATVQQLAQGTRFKELFKAYDTCALTADGKVLCVEGSAMNAGKPELKPEAANLIVSSLYVSLGRRCALTTNGELHCWTSGGTAPRHLAPALTFTSFSMEGGNGCAIAADGSLHCWGENSDGQVGDGTRSSRDTPVPVRLR